jgi:aldehyde:ferredoxin oxidoreductase
MIEAKSGESFSEEDWANIGKRILQREVEFNRKAGFTKEKDRLPKMFYEEPLPPHNTVVVIPDEAMDAVFNFFTE